MTRRKVTASNILINWSVMVKIVIFYSLSYTYITMLYIFDTIKINVEGNAARKFISDSDYKYLKIMRRNCFSLDSKVVILKLFFVFDI